MMGIVLHTTIRSKAFIMFLRQCTISSPVSALPYIDAHALTWTVTFVCEYFRRGAEQMYLYHSPTSVHVCTDVPHISQAPVLMLRPRAWNMVEHNMMVGQCFLFLVLSHLFIESRLGSISVFCILLYIICLHGLRFKDRCVGFKYLTPAPPSGGMKT